MDIRTLQSALARLAEDRADDPLQAPKNIAISLGAEAGILLSLFRGLTERQGLEEDVSREIAAEALTSILVHVAQLSNHVGLDASAGLRARIKGRPAPPLAAPNTVPVVIPRSLRDEPDATPSGSAPVVADAPTPDTMHGKAEPRTASPEPARSTAGQAETPRGESAGSDPSKVQAAPPGAPEAEAAQPEAAKAAAATSEPAKSEPATVRTEAATEGADPAGGPVAAARIEASSTAAKADSAAAKHASRKRGGAGVIAVKVDPPPAPVPAAQASTVEVVVVEDPVPVSARPAESAAAEPHDGLDRDSVLDLANAMSRELDRSTRDDPVLRDLRDELETLRRSLYASNTKKAWLAGSLRSLRHHLEETLSHSFAEDLRSQHFIGRIDAMLAR
jgi:hypothetical protein